MKKLLLIAAVVLLIACVVSLLFAAMSLFTYRHMLDGSAEHYVRLHRNAILFFVIGIVLALLAAACMLVRRKG